MRTVGVMPRKNVRMRFKSVVLRWMGSCSREEVGRALEGEGGCAAETVRLRGRGYCVREGRPSLP